MKSGQLVVKDHNPWLRRVALASVAIASIVGGWLLYDFGQRQGGFNRFDAERERVKLTEQLVEFEKENKRLKEQVTVLERTQEIDSEAYNKVRVDLKQLQEEILELREETDFYRGIVSPSERMAGLAIQTFKLEPAGEEGLYHFDLVMTQVLKNDRFVHGVVKCSVQGVQDGEPMTLDFREISPNDSVGRDFRFRYFQKMEGDIRLPEGFVARTVIIELAPNGRKTVIKSFPWQVNGAVKRVLNQEPS